ncbi:MAG: hypothetical protein E6R03_14790 [Hyphomicrobiaceae bacterium]|nr:MAG: hypothetical protein E6R03_14790 [Hyphomicrobiaceae bacterium]
MNSDSPFRDNEAATLRVERDSLKTAVDELRAENNDLDAENRSNRAQLQHTKEQLADLMRQANARKKSNFMRNATGLVGLLGAVAIVVGICVAIGSGVSSCQDARNMEAGYIIRRDYHPPYYTQSCTTTTKTTTCVPIYHPERHTITIADGAHEERVIDLDEGTWRRHPPGELYCVDGVHCSRPVDDAADH